MKTVPLAEAPHRISELAQCLTDGGVVCLPINGSYRLLADAFSDAAIVRLAQMKRRMKDHPSLVLVADRSAARRVVHGMAWTTTKQLADAFWPGALTLALPASHDLPPRVKKLLSRATGRIGVRVTADPIASALVQAFANPIITTSANLERKPGASSAQTVQQRFMSTVDVWVDAGDMQPGPPSTIIELSETSYKLLRAGSIAADALDRTLASPMGG